MRMYKVSYWSEGPGQSHYENVLVVANSKKQAIDFIIKNCGVYKADQPYVKATLVKSEPAIIKRL